MEPPFFTSTRAEALRWLTIAEKLLSARDLMGSKSFATRARDSDPTLSHANQILAVADTLLAGDRRIGNNEYDWYAILRLTPPQGRDPELIASQYRSLALLLNPQKNKFSFSNEAFRLVVDAWSALSDPSRKSVYDKQLAFYLHQQQNFMIFGDNDAAAASGVSQPQVHVGGSSSGVPSHFAQFQPQSFSNFNSGTNFGFGSGLGSKSSHEPVNVNQEQVNTYKQKENYGNASDRTTSHKVSDNAQERREDRANVDVPEEDEDRVDEPKNGGDGSTFWTACPYCYYMYEYHNMYTDCSLRCQNCKMVFQAVAIPSPPPVVDGQEGYFSCWGFIPLGFSMENWEKNKGATPAWTPFSPMFTCPQMGNNVNKKGGRKKSSGPRVYVDDDEVFVAFSDSDESDDDWQNGSQKKKKKKAKYVKGKGAHGTPNKSAKITELDKGKNVDVQDVNVSQVGVEMPEKTTSEPSKKGSTGNARKQPGRVAKNFGKLDLNVELSNEAEEPAPRVNPGNGQGRGEDDNIAGIGFFEGLDEFLSSLPILNVVGDDKFVKAA
ncbi:hypothetical protein ACJIZ3_015648 [Penstemon smallii]|uniref:J domain-containing protein n=1 Tax=Penstemon smallii TaxID=265156 RepID=A0ABD3RUQ3_9LAMI